MNWLALVLAIVCALIALAYALPMLALGAVLRFLDRALMRRTGIRLPLELFAFARLPWAPVLLWGTAAFIFGWIAVSG